MIGNVVGNYRVIDKIGEGGMGAVYKGIDLMLEREVAIKVLRAELARQPDIVERFRAEAVTLAKLNHPNIATLYSFFRQGDDFFMVMEFVRGLTLEYRIRQSGAMPAELAIPLFCLALDGLDHAHRMGIIHRDIKPANMMLTESGSIKIMDFGIARVLGTARVTRQGSVVGTIEYMSPEQVRGEETDARSDLYSMGVLLYEMLTGRVPFSGQSEYELMKAHIESTPPRPASFGANVSSIAESAILMALAKNPAERFQSAADFKSALAGAADGTGHVTRPNMETLPQTPFQPNSQTGAATLPFPAASGLNAQPPIVSPRLSATGRPGTPAQSGGLELKETRIPAPGQPWPNLYGSSQSRANQGVKETRLPVSTPYNPRLDPQAWLQNPTPRKQPLHARLNWKHYLTGGIVLTVLLVFPFVVLFMLKDQVQRSPASVETGQPAAAAQPSRTQDPSVSTESNSQAPEQTQPQPAPTLAIQGAPGALDLGTKESEAAKNQKSQKEAEARREAAARDKARRRAAAERALDQ